MSDDFVGVEDYLRIYIGGFNRFGQFSDLCTEPDAGFFCLFEFFALLPCEIKLGQSVSGPGGCFGIF